MDYEERRAFAKKLVEQASEKLAKETVREDEKHYPSMATRTPANRLEFAWQYLSYAHGRTKTLEKRGDLLSYEVLAVPSHLSAKGGNAMQLSLHKRCDNPGYLEGIRRMLCCWDIVVIDRDSESVTVVVNDGPQRIGDIGRYYEFRGTNLVEETRKKAREGA